jgi:hypothetical protein
MGEALTLRTVAGGGGQGATVWHAVLANGAETAVKQHLHADAGEVEYGVLQMLHRLGAPVVQPLHWLPQERVLITTWVGADTLAATVTEVQQHSPEQFDQLRQLARSLTAGCASLETAFQGMAARLPDRLSGELDRRRAEVRARCQRATHTLERLATHLDSPVPRGWLTELQSAWITVANETCASPLTFGGRDCSPLNVLVDDQRLRFVDFAVVGLDWPEARLAQYAAVAGWQQPGSLPVSLLTHGKEQWYVENGCIESALLDMHHVLLWCEMLRLLLDDNSVSHETTGEMQKLRMRRALQLILVPLATNTPVEPVRSLVATEFGHVIGQ